MPDPPVQCRIWAGGFVLWKLKIGRYGHFHGDETTKIFLNADSEMDDVGGELKEFLNYAAGQSIMYPIRWTRQAKGIA